MHTMTHFHRSLEGFQGKSLHEVFQLAGLPFNAIEAVVQSLQQWLRLSRLLQL